MTDAIPYIIQGDNITLIVDGRPCTISKDTHISYKEIVEALKSEDWDAIKDFVEPKEVLVNYGRGNLVIEDNKMFWKGEPFHNALSNRIISMFREGFPINPMIAFMENLMNNPSKTAVDELYLFLENNSLPITEDGCFLAYKRVRSNYTDCYSGEIDNSVGAKLFMDRNLVDDNRERHCSQGYHFCSIGYIGHFGNDVDPIMILKVNPADVVSIPSDYNNAKGRCWRYEVVGEVSGSPEEAFKSSVDTYYMPPREPATDDVWDDEEDDEWDDWLNDDVYGHSDAINGVAGKYYEDYVRKDDSYDEFEESDDDENDSSGCDWAHYRLDRVSSGQIEYNGLTLEEAREQRDKNLRQKKAVLKIIDEITGEEIE